MPIYWRSGSFPRALNANYLAERIITPRAGHQLLFQSALRRQALYANYLAKRSKTPGAVRK